jgi:ParB family chromosome partitioning protein
MSGLLKGKASPRLKNIDDMFGLNDGVNTIEIDKLTPFNGHLFRLYEGERLDDMVESIRVNGVLVPIIVRKVATVLEILSGHNRVNAAKLAGLTEVPAIVKENVSDDEAMVYIIETNLIQRSFSDMTHTEKAAVISLHHSKMFSQGKRNDILEQIKMLENPHKYNENATSTQVGEKLLTVKKVGEMYSLSKNTVSRYIRIQQLVPALKFRLDKDEITFIPAVTLSFLKEDEQNIVNECMEQSKFSVDMKKAETLRLFSESGKLTEESVKMILSGEVKSKASVIPTIKLKKAVYEKYFTLDQSTKEIQTIVEKALDMYFNKKK